MFLFAYLELTPGTEVTVNCNVSTFGVCTVRNKVKLLNCDNLKFDVDDVDSISELNLRYQIKLGRIPYGIFATFHQLQILRIAQHRIRFLESGRLQGATKLHTLDLSFNEISTIPDYVLDGMGNLQILHLSKNHIRRISRFSFAGADKLKELYLNVNNIETVEEGSLSLPDLETLDLEDNRIQILGILSMPKLINLNLSSNKIRALNITLLAGLPSLSKISLSLNGLTQIKKVFSGNKQLIELDLSRNDIESIEAGALNLRNLKLLNLGGNKLKRLCSLKLPKLLNLDISMNKFKILNDTFLIGLPRLRNINLSMNSITNIGNVFSSSNKLKKLDLSANDIESIAEDSLNLPNLINLDLGWNKLKRLNDSFQFTRNLRILNLERNQLSHIENIFSGMDSLIELNLSGNEIVNLKHLEKLHLLFGNNSSHGINSVASKLQKISLDGNSLSDPNIFKYLSIFPQLEKLDANSNKFQSFNDIDKIRNYLPKIKMINFIDNTPSMCDWIYINKKWLENITVYGSTAIEVCSSTYM